MYVYVGNVRWKTIYTIEFKWIVYYACYLRILLFVFRHQTT